MIGSLWDLKHEFLDEVVSAEMAIMIGSLWDLKRDIGLNIDKEINKLS